MVNVQLTIGNYERLIDHMERLSVINTHSHHGVDDSFSGYNLDSILRKTYVTWTKADFDDTYKGRQEYLNRVRFNSYFVFLQEALQRIYGFEDTISADNWDTISEFVRDSYKDTEWHIKILRENCVYKKIILDAFWTPGSDNDHPELFTPNFRVNMFFFGYDRTAADHNDNNAQLLYDASVDNIDDYLLFMRKIIAEKKKNGCVALKSALAYERGLDFEIVSKDTAQKAFRSNRTKADIKAFQDFLFYETCRIAAEMELPHQIHTGTGILEKSNAFQLKDVIERNPETKFVLFHGSYPWLEDVCALLHKYDNVYPDLCWLPIISESAGRRFLSEVIDVGLSDKACWGCDTFTSDESFGALLAMRHVLASVLSEKVSYSYLTISDAEEIINRILYMNPLALYY